MSGVTITGIEQTESLFKELTDAQVRNVANKIGDIVVDAMSANIARDTGASQKSIKKQVRKSDGGIKVSISPHTHYYIYDEFGTSKVKNNIGKLYRDIEGSKNECIDTAKELAKNYAKKIKKRFS